MSNHNNLIINKSKSFHGKINIPGDKSISHRSIILGSIADGTLKITNFLNSDDCLNTISAMKMLGADITLNKTQVTIKGLGLFGLKKPNSVIDAGNSGTLIRLLTGVLATQNFSSSISGDDSLRNRPMRRIIEPLSNVGAEIQSVNFKAPLTITPKTKISPISYTQEIASAQIKSCMILAALFIKGKHKFYEKIPTRDHTENLLEHFGCDITRSKNTFTISGHQKLLAKNIEISADISSASFFIVAALILKDSEITIPDVNINEYINTIQFSSTELTLFLIMQSSRRATPCKKK